MSAPAHRPPERLEAGPVVLQRGRPEHAEAVAAAVAASLDHLRPWMFWATPESSTVEQQRTRLSDAAEQWEKGTAFDFVVLSATSGEVVGNCGLMRRGGPGEIEIGYWVHVDHTGRGYGRALAGALTDAGSALADVDRVEIHCDRANLASAAIPRALGYRLDREAPGRFPQAPAETGRDQIWVMSASQ
ncbi:GNAT family N-acetyltransferase [soil metagenome]